MSKDRTITISMTRMNQHIISLKSLYIGQQRLQLDSLTKRYKGGNVNASPSSRPEAAKAILALNVATLVYDTILPYAIYREHNKITKHNQILQMNVMNDIDVAYKQGLLNQLEINLQNVSKLLNVILYGDKNNHSDKYCSIIIDTFFFALSLHFSIRKILIYLGKIRF